MNISENGITLAEAEELLTATGRKTDEEMIEEIANGPNTDLAHALSVVWTEKQAQPGFMQPSRDLVQTVEEVLPIPNVFDYYGGFYGDE
jgi:hypothetical protein